MKKKSISFILMSLMTLLLFSCMSWSPPTEKKPYKPIKKIKNVSVVNVIELDFLSHGIAGYRDENANISETAYKELLKAAKEKYGDNVDVADVTWVELKFNQSPDPSEFYARGKVIIKHIVGIEDALARAAKEAIKGIEKNSVIAIIYITAQDRAIINYIAGELEFIWFKEGYIITDRSQLDLLRQEQNFQISGEVDDGSAVSIGKILGADVIVTGIIDGYGNLQRLRLRVLDTETAQVLGVASEQLGK